MVAPIVAAAQNPFAGNAKETDVGRGLFRIVCAPCHGIQAKGGRGPDLTLGVYRAGSEDTDLYRVIAEASPVRRCLALWNVSAATTCGG